MADEKPPLTVDEKLSILLKMFKRLEKRIEELEFKAKPAEFRPYEPGDDDEDPQIYLPRGR